MPEYVFFDLGLTLVHNDMPARYRRAFKKLGLDFTARQTARAYHLANKYFMRFKQGRLSRKDRQTMKDYHQKVCRILGAEERRDDFLARLREEPMASWQAFDFTLPMLKQLKESGIKVGLISNWDPSCRSVLAENGIDEYMDRIFVSREVGYEKPRPQIFAKALEETGADPGKCLYVGDNYYDDYIGATNAGMQCVIINLEDRLGVEEIDCPFVVEKARDILPLIQEGKII